MRSRGRPPTARGSARTPGSRAVWLRDRLFDLVVVGVYRPHDARCPQLLGQRGELRQERLDAAVLAECLPPLLRCGERLVPGRVVDARQVTGRGLGAPAVYLRPLLPIV